MNVNLDWVIETRSFQKMPFQISCWVLCNQFADVRNRNEIERSDNARDGPWSPSITTSFQEFDYRISWDFVSCDWFQIYWSFLNKYSLMLRFFEITESVTCRLKKTHIFFWEMLRFLFNPTLTLETMPIPDPSQSSYFGSVVQVYLLFHPTIERFWPQVEGPKCSAEVQGISETRTSETVK